MTVNVEPSARLYYRLLDRNDVELLLDLDNDPNVMQFINGGQPTTKEEMTTVMLPRMLSYRNPAKGWGMWGAFCKQTDEFLGWVLARPMYFFDEHYDANEIELGWRFKASSWGKGIGTEAAQQIMASLTAHSQAIKAF